MVSSDNSSVPPWKCVVSSAAFARDVEVETAPRSGGSRVTWQVGDLRLGTTEIGDELFAVVTADHIGERAISWRGTSRGVNYVFGGQIILTCAQERAVHLRWVPWGSGDDPA